MSLTHHYIALYGFFALASEAEAWGDLLKERLDLTIYHEYEDLPETPESLIFIYPLHDSYILYLFFQETEATWATLSEKVLGIGIK